MNTNVARLRYHGTGGALFGLVLRNGLLTMVTLGIYSFWAKTRIREFHYSHTEMDGDRFAYHGTGGELLRGYLKAVGILILLGIAVGVLMPVFGGRPGSAILPLAVLLPFYVALFLLGAAAVNGARRYRLSRSSWRGIRFSFHGSVTDFIALIVRGTLLTIVTLGFYLPYFQSQRRAFFVRHARFGSEPFQYDGDGREMFGEFIKAVLLTIPTLGLYWIWYAAFKHRYFWGHTTMRGGRFQSTVTGTDLFTMTVTNLLLVIVTLGFGTTWALTRVHAFFCDRMSLHGTVDWASIRQQAQAAGTAAEGMADAMDIDIGIGM